MKKAAFIIGFLFTFAILANAQTHKQIAAHIPFDFYVKDQKMRAGDYLIESISPHSNQSMLVIKTKSGEAKGMLITLPIELNKSRKFLLPKIIFNRYNYEYFLAEIHNPLGEIGFEITKTKMEKYVAKKFGKPTQETVVAQK